MPKGTAEDPIALFDVDDECGPTAPPGTKYDALKAQKDSAGKKNRKSIPRAGDVVHDLTISDDEPAKHSKLLQRDGSNAHGRRDTTLSTLSKLKERKEKEPTPVEVLPKATGSTASSPYAENSTIAQSSKAHNAISAIPIRTTSQTTASPPASTNDALVPSDPRARLAYVMDSKHRNSVNQELANGSTSVQETEPVAHGLSAESKRPVSTKPQPVKHARARKIAQNKSSRLSPNNSHVTPATALGHPVNVPRTEASGQALSGENNSTVQESFPLARAANLTMEATMGEPSEQQASTDNEGFGSGLEDSPVAISQAMNAHDLELTTAAVEERLKVHLQTVHQAHQKKVRFWLKKQRLCFEQVGRWNELSWTKSVTPMIVDTEVLPQTYSPFEKLCPIQKPLDQKGTNSFYFSQEVFTKSRTKAGVTSKMTVPVTKFRSTATNVPPFRSYVSVQDNVLAENERTLLNWPYFPDEKDRDDMTDDLEKHYKMRNVTHKWQSLLSDVHDFYKDSVEAFLADVDLAWEDILYWYLASEVDIARINKTLSHGKNDFESVILRREIDLDYRFDRAVPKWQGMLERLPRPSARNIRFAALACLSFSKFCGFDLWHFARRSNLIQQEVAASLESNNTKQGDFEYRQTMCRVCQLQNCPFHGELREQLEEPSFSRPGSPTGSNEVDSSGAQANCASEENEEEPPTDSDIEDVDNYRRFVNAHTHTPMSSVENDDQKQFPKPAGEFKAQWWLANTNAATWEKRKPFYPCSHEGTCDQARCHCYMEKITCEKSCECSSSCARRFPGCSCSQVEGKVRLCGTKQCLCYVMSRECDGDLCSSCGASQILDAAYSNNKVVWTDKCCNVALQLGDPKGTLLGHSEVHGFGLFTGEDVKAGDFLGEYKGEIITTNEGYRRGIIYEKQQTMYLFRLNNEQEIDSTNFGNKTRFINNSNPELANCGPRNLLCNTVHRIGLFANKDIPAGTELFFHYGYPDKETKHFKEPGAKSSTKLVAVKQTKRDIPRVRASTPDRRRQTEKARAALLAKRREKDASGGLDKDCPRSTGRAIKTGQRRAPTGNKVATLEAQESDQDEDYIPDEGNALEDTQATGSDEDGNATDVSESLTRRRRAGSRRGMAPVLIVKYGKRGSARKKRKRLVVESDGDD